MKKEKKAGLIGLALFASMFLTSPSSINEKNDINEPVLEPPKATAQSIASHQEPAISLEYTEKTDTLCEEEFLQTDYIDNNEINRGNITSLEDTFLDEENIDSQDEIMPKVNYLFGYVKEDTKIYNATLGKEEIIEAYQKVIIVDKLKKVTIIEYTNEDNIATIGLIPNELLGKLTDTYIEIDISDQTIKMYIDGELALDSVVVTGNPYLSPTPTGYFHVLEKRDHTFLRGNRSSDGGEYCSWIDYGLRFYQGYFIHDSERHMDPEIGIGWHGWRNTEDFGGDTYLTRGGEGCPNTLNETAKFVFEHSQEETETQEGTEILIHR